MTRAGAWLSLWAALAACSDNNAPNSRRPGLPPAPNVGTVPPPEPSLDEEGDEPAGRAAFDSFDTAFEAPADPTAPAAPGPGSANAAQEDDEGADDEKRDLGEELVALLQPGACIDPNAGAISAGEVLRIRAEATVMPSGRVQRASAHCPGQPKQALACLVRQLEAGHLQSPIEDAPRRVTGTLRVEVQSVPTRTPQPGN